MSNNESNDVNANAARIAGEATDKHEQPLPAGLEVAWAECPNPSPV